MVTTKEVPPGKMAATNNVLGGNAHNDSHSSCGNNSCKCDTSVDNPTMSPSTIFDAVKSGFVICFIVIL